LEKITLSGTYKKYNLDFSTIIQISSFAWRTGYVKNVKPCWGRPGKLFESGLFKSRLFQNYLKVSRLFQIELKLNNIFWTVFEQLTLHVKIIIELRFNMVFTLLNEKFRVGKRIYLCLDQFPVFYCYHLCVNV